MSFAIASISKIFPMPPAPIASGMPSLVMAKSLVVDDDRRNGHRTRPDDGFQSPYSIVIFSGCQEIKTRETAPITTKITIAAMIMAIVYPVVFSAGDFHSLSLC
ncbi:MAG: hypothetical protein NTW71_06615 [Deltaproteobacteria bacterium]|nr:hypothetical protein [Deltaproteobacteria bacterium]